MCICVPRLRSCSPPVREPSAQGQLVSGQKYVAFCCPAPTIRKPSVGHHEQPEQRSRAPPMGWLGGNSKPPKCSTPLSLPSLTRAIDAPPR